MKKTMYVKKVYRGAGKQIWRDLRQMWYANPNNLTASGVEVGDFVGGKSKQSAHVFDKRTVRAKFEKDFRLVFVEKKKVRRK